MLSYVNDFATFVDGGREIQRRVPREKLQALIHARRRACEPDVFLVKDDGEVLFIEVKG